MLNEIISPIGSGLAQYRQDTQSGNWPGALAAYVVNNEFNLNAIGVFASGFSITSGVSTRLPPRTSTDGNFSSRRELWIFNNDNSNVIYIGQSGITSLTGYPIPTGQCLKLMVAGNIDIFGITEASACQVKTLELA